MKELIELVKEIRDMLLEAKKEKEAAEKGERLLNKAKAESWLE